MTVTIHCREIADGVLQPLQDLLDLWIVHGSHDISVAVDGGWRFGPVAESKQAALFEAKLSKARTLADTPHGRRCAIDCWPFGFHPQRDFEHQPLPGMLGKFLKWGAFIDQLGPALGIRWGGHFKGFGRFGDLPHAEIIGWDHLYEFPSGFPAEIKK